MRKIVFLMLCALLFTQSVGVAQGKTDNEKSVEVTLFYRSGRFKYGITNADLTLVEILPGKKFRILTTVKTDDTGIAKFTVKSGINLYIRVEALGYKPNSWGPMIVEEWCEIELAMRAIEYDSSWTERSAQQETQSAKKKSKRSEREARQ